MPINTSRGTDTSNSRSSDYWPWNLSRNGQCERKIALGVKNYFFNSLTKGGKVAAIACTLIETVRVKAVDSQAGLSQVLERIPNYKINRIDELLPSTLHRRQRLRLTLDNARAIAPDAYNMSVELGQEELVAENMDFF